MYYQKGHIMSPQMLRSHQSLGLGFLKAGAGILEACEVTNFSLWADHCMSLFGQNTSKYFLFPL